LLICGNGGSSADADHFAAELMKILSHRALLMKALGAAPGNLRNPWEISGRKAELRLPAISFIQYCTYNGNIK
jgi:hypothetical protein